VTLPAHERRWNLLIQVRDGLRDAARHAARLSDLAWTDRDRDLAGTLERLLREVEKDLGIRLRGGPDGT